MNAISVEHFVPRIFIVRGEKVILDAELAQIYGVNTARLNQQLTRNLKKFPRDFVFRLTSIEFKRLMLQFATSKKRRGGRRKLPWAFTEHGAIMIATVLNTERAVAMSVYIVRAFIKFRKILGENKDLANKLAELERKLTERLDVHGDAIRQLFEEIREILNPPLPTDASFPKRKIGFHRD